MHKPRQTYTLRNKPEKLRELSRMRRAMASVVSPRPWEAVDNDFDTEHWDPIMFEEFLDSLQFYFRNLAPGHLRKFLKNE